MIWNILEGGVFGFLAHQTRTWVDRLPGGYRELLSYLIGVLAAMPIAIRAYERSGRIGIARLVEAYCVAFAAVGGGVVAGWVTDTLVERVSE